MSLINRGVEVYYSLPIRWILRNSVDCLIRELKNCRTVLDLGCGYNSLLRYCRPKMSVGLDFFMPYLLESRRKNIHRFYVRGDIEKIEFKANSFDAVLLLSVIEHMKKEAGLKLLDKLSRIARKKVIIITPNGYLKQLEADGNDLQAHKSGWQVDELVNMGFKAFGLCGLKMFRKDSHCADSSDYRRSLLSTMKFEPKLVWLIICELSQMIACHFPALAFEVFYVKNKD